MTDGWRYIAQRYDGNSGAFGEFLDFNIPLTGVNIEEVLSGHNSVTGTISPEYARLKGADGLPILQEWGTAIWAETPDGELYGGLLTHSGFDGPQWTVECTDLSGITIDLPYTDESWWVNIDPIDIFRFIWAKIQASPGGNVGVSMDGTTSPVRLGTDLVQHVDFDTEFDPSAGLDDTPADPPPIEEEDVADPVPVPVAPNRYASNAAWREAGVKAMKAVGWNGPVVDEALGKWLNKDTLIENNNWPKGGLTDKEKKIRDRTIEKIGWPPNPPNPGHRDGAAAAIVVDASVYPADPLDPPPEPGEPPTPTQEEVAEGPTYQYDAYKLVWYRDHDLSSTISDLATNTPFDWHMTHHWFGEDIRHHIRIGYPRLGRRREELRFVVGENIHTAPSVERDGTEYANEVLVLGAGEGSAMIMGRAFRREDGRVRKVVTISDPSITTTEAANARANAELARRFNVDNITDLILVDHPHAPMGAVSLGDEILVEGDLGWIDLNVWCRVIARTLSPDDGNAMKLTLIRSDRLT